MKGSFIPIPLNFVIQELMASSCHLIKLCRRPSKHGTDWKQWSTQSKCTSQIKKLSTCERLYFDIGHNAGIKSYCPLFLKSIFMKKYMQYYIRDISTFLSFVVEHSFISAVTWVERRHQPEYIMDKTRKIDKSLFCFRYLSLYNNTTYLAQTVFYICNKFCALHNNSILTCVFCFAVVVSSA